MYCCRNRVHVVLQLPTVHVLRQESTLLAITPACSANEVVYVAGIWLIAHTQTHNLYALRTTITDPVPLSRNTHIATAMLHLHALMVVSLSGISLPIGDLLLP